LPRDYSAADFERAVRHGVKRDGTSLWFIPSNHYCYITDEDIAALYAFVRSLPPVDGGTPETVVRADRPDAAAAGQTAAAIGGHDGSSRPAFRGRRPDRQPNTENIWLKWGAWDVTDPISRAGPITGAPPEWPPPLI